MVSCINREVHMVLSVVMSFNKVILLCPLARQMLSRLLGAQKRNAGSLDVLDSNLQLVKGNKVGRVA